MASTKPDELPDASSQSSLCRHLRSAGMYVYAKGDHDDTAEEYDSSSYWCLQTMKTFGPDDEMVGSRECRDPSRSCYEPF
jgi:hypothetical protein